jgi:hypothetical protein
MEYVRTRPKQSAGHGLARDSLHAVHVPGHCSVFRLLTLRIKFGRWNDELCGLSAHGATLCVPTIDDICGFVHGIAPLLYALKTR